MNKNICEYSEYNKYRKIECKVCENKPCLYQRYCTQDSTWWCSDAYFQCERRNKAMSKQKDLTNSEVVLTENVEEKKEKVISEDVKTEEKVETFSQKSKPSKKQNIISKQKGKVVGITETTVKVLLDNGNYKVIKKPNYPVKLRDIIDTIL